MTQTLSMDQVFINKLTEIVLANLSDEHFSVEKLAKAAGMSHVSLHRRLKAVKNQDVSQFIREIRLQRAMELLRQNAGTASEIAYRVGFGSPAYFNKCFHEYYGFPPGEVKKRNLIQPEQKNGTITQELSASVQETAIIVPKPSCRIKLNQRIVILTAAVVIILLPLSYYLYRSFIKETDSVSKLEEYDNSIVVLPFKDLSGHPDNQYFADGIMEDILNSLVRVSRLRVISRTTSEYFRGTNLTAKEVARKLNARYMLEGSVRRYDDKTRITVQLIDAYRDQHLWSENFDRDLTDIIGIQGSIATQVALKLKAAIPGIEIKRIEIVLTRNPEAYDNYLKGKFLLNKASYEQRVDISKEGLTGSILYFEKAIAADTNFAEAYAGLANATFNIAAWGWMEPGMKGFLKAKELSIKALEIDPGCAEAHGVKGAVHIWG